MGSLADSVRVYRNRARRLATLGLVILLVIFSGKCLYSIWNHLQIGDIWFNDFFAIWSFAKFPIANQPFDIYDRLILHEFQESLGASPTIYLPYPYPPSFLLLVIPFGIIGYYASYGVWIFGTFIFYFSVSWHREWPRSAALIVLLAPSTWLTLLFGQTGFLTSALMVGGFRFAATRPMLSGIFFGLLSIKPQLGILVPIALISARLWRTLAAASVTVLVLVLASGAAFGWSIWPLWLSQLPAHAAWASGSKPEGMPTIVGNLIFLGIAPSLARTVQLAAAVVVAGYIWACFRHGVTKLGTSAVLVGTFLATPYAFIYDMPMLTNAVLTVVRDREAMGRRLAIPETLILVLALLLPMLMVELWRFAAIRTIPLILLFGLIIRHFAGAQRGVAESEAGLAKDPVEVR